MATLLYYLYSDKSVSVGDATELLSDLYEITKELDSQDLELAKLLSLHCLADEWLIPDLQRRVDKDIMDFDYGYGFWATFSPHGEDECKSWLLPRWLRTVYKELPPADEIRIKATMQGLWYSRYCVSEAEVEVLAIMEEQEPEALRTSKLWMKR